jgi:hypothetical protein
MIVTAFLLTIGTSVFVIVAISGWDSLRGVITSFGMAREYGIARGLPSWQRMTAELCALSLLSIILFSCLLMGLGAARNIGPVFVSASLMLVLAGIYVYMTVQTGMDLRANGGAAWPTPTEAGLWSHVEAGHSLLRPALRLLRIDVQKHLFPALLPALVWGIILVRWRHLRPRRLRATVVVLLGLCVASRLRRGFEFVEWYHFLLEVPAYTLTIRLFFGEQHKATILGLAILSVIGLDIYRREVVDRVRDLERIETPRGVAYWGPEDAELYKSIKNHLTRLDPTGERPVFSFGHNGGFNYFLARPNPTPITLGFLTSVVDPEIAVRTILNTHPKPFLIYNGAYENAGVPALRVDLWRWAQPYEGNHYMRHDLQYFKQLVNHCRETALNRKRLTIYDCQQ